MAHLQVIDRCVGEKTKKVKKSKKKTKRKSCTLSILKKHLQIFISNVSVSWPSPGIYKKMLWNQSFFERTAFIWNVKSLLISPIDYYFVILVIDSFSLHSHLKEWEISLKTSSYLYFHSREKGTWCLWWSVFAMIYMCVH